MESFRGGLPVLLGGADFGLHFRVGGLRFFQLRGDGGLRGFSLLNLLRDGFDLRLDAGGVFLEGGGQRPFEFGLVLFQDDQRLIRIDDITGGVFHDVLRFEEGFGGSLVGGFGGFHLLFGFTDGHLRVDRQDGEDDDRHGNQQFAIA